MASALLASPQSARNTITTHTAAADTTPSSDQALVATLQDSAFTFLHPSPSLHAAALVLSKRYLDPLAISTSQIQTTRLQANRKKRKRGESDDQDARNVLRLQQIHLEGFGVDQVWEQARRVLDATRKETERLLPQVLAQPLSNGHEQVPARKPKQVRFDEAETGSSAEELVEEELENYESEHGSEELEDISEDVEMADIEESGEDIEADSDLEYDETLDEGEHLVKDKHGLNDGFFSIDDFNRQTEFLEQQDARGDPDDGAASDEEDVDWTTDPMSRLPEQKSGEDESEDGPTFGNADLNAPWSDDDDDEEEDQDQEMDMDDPTSITNEIHYEDFFAPPPRTQTKSARMRALPKTQPSNQPSNQPTEEDIQRTISSVKRDIFEDDDMDDDLDPEDTNAADDPSLSTHERRQARLAAQIRELEKAAVEKREWALMGEARAVDRPQNALLEEDLEFERAGKPVPVITAEISKSIEDLVKQRILDRNFDELIKRRRGTELQSSTARRGLLDSNDAEAERSMGLAEVYEQEHLKKNDPNYTSSSDKKLKAAHDEIETLWKDVSSKLDALTSWHYRPKPADMQISVVSDASRIEMEDARPGAATAMSGEQSGLAPQEVYRPGEDGSKDKGDGPGDVVTKGGGIVGKEELSREQKRRRRNREKERAKKRGEGEDGKKVESKKTQEKKNVVGDLKRGGVKVIGKGGEIKDVEGRAVKGKTAGGVAGAGNFKL